MTITEYTHHKELRPDEGKVLFDGKDYTTAVSMPLSADHSKWQDADAPDPEGIEEITDAEALEIITGQ